MQKDKKIKRFFKKIIKKSDVYGDNNFYCCNRDYTKLDNIIFIFEINQKYKIKLTIDYTNLDNIKFIFDYSNIVNDLTKKYFIERKIHLFNTILNILNKIFNIFKSKIKYNILFNIYFYKISDENRCLLFLENIVFKNSKLK